MSFELFISIYFFGVFVNLGLLTCKGVFVFLTFDRVYWNNLKQLGFYYNFLSGQCCDAENKSNFFNYALVIISDCAFSWFAVLLNIIQILKIISALIFKLNTPPERVKDIHRMLASIPQSKLNTLMLVIIKMLHMHGKSISEENFLKFYEIFIDEGYNVSDIDSHKLLAHFKESIFYNEKAKAA